METEAPELVRFSSSASVVVQNRKAVEEIYAAITRMNITLAPDGPLGVNMAMRLLPGVSVASIDASPYRIDRTKAQTADGNDDFVLTLSWCSGIAARQPGREAQFRSGQAYLWRNDLVMTAQAPTGARLFNIVVPRASLLPMVADIDAALKDAIHPSLPLRLLADYAAEVTGAAPLSSEAAAMMASHIRDLVASALGARPISGDEPGGVRAARLAAIKRDILANLAEPALSLQWLSARHMISSHYVRALFRQDRTAFSDFVR